MKIALDATYAGLSTSQKGGIYQYIFYLVQALGELDKENEYLLFFSFFKNRHRRACDEFYSFFEANCERKFCRLPSVIWKRFRFPIELFTGRVDIFHGLFNYVPPVFSGKSVVTIHDLAYLRRPEFLQSNWVRSKNWETSPSAKRADLIITISSFSKNDLIELLGIPEEKIRVVPHGVSPSFVPIRDKETLEKIREKHGIKENYILFVGMLQPCKNIVSLLEAFSELKNSSNLPHQLVIAGGKGWIYDEIFQRFKELKLEKDVIFTGHVSHDELPALYSGADLFILPSRFESFGIPVLEAMACGTPVIASNACALPETTGGATLLVSPDSILEIAEGMYKVLSDSNLQKVLREKGLKRAKELIWERTARMTLDVYEEVSGN